jgi:ketosteroid isomerase-like protein
MSEQKAPSEEIEAAIAGDALLALENEWARAVSERDTGAAEKILADDFALTSEGGVSEFMPREEWLATLPQIETGSLSCDVRQARVFGDTAVVRAHLHWEARMGELDFTGEYAVTDVFRKVDGRWRATWRISVRLSNA